MILVRKTEEECGNYVDEYGCRFMLEWCHKVYSKTTPEALGYEAFDSMEDALAWYGLTEYVAPEAEELLTEA